MAIVEAAATAAGKAVATKAVREWLLARASAKDLGADLKDLIRNSYRDRLAVRKFENQIEGVALAIEARLSALLEQEYRGLADNDRAAVLHEVVATLQAADLSDAALFKADADSARVAEQLMATLPSPKLSDAEQQLYMVLLAECVDCLVGMMRELPQYLPRAATETLARLTGLAEGVERLLARMPVRTLDAPEGSQNDEAFERQYLSFVSRTMDEVELFGVRVESFRPRTSLSVAYISLSVSTEESKARTMAERLSIASLTDPVAPEPGMLRIESALGRSRLTLVRGDAGSGKSTLLRWLAVTAAFKGFSGDLTEWNGCVPLIIKLRSHSDGRFPAPPDFLNDVAQELAGRMPRGWVERVLDAGRGLLLVDGVDELVVRHRQAVRQWLTRLLAAYPSMRVIVTSRPAAADAKWLAEEGFTAALLEPMTSEDLRELVRQWHIAMRDCPSLPCAADELPSYEGALLARLESSGHLRTLASTPLLAAMLCALNLDRRTQLPRSRMGLYDAVLALLLERRDAERGIRDDVILDPEQKIWILRDLAWRLVSMGRSELSRATALKRIEQRLSSMTRMPYTAEMVLEHLVRRSGALREPVPGRIDFAHRTVQEYLAAEQLVEDEDMEVVVERAHLDQWREVVVMVAGHATGRLRRELLQGLLNRADSGDRHARKLRMLVAACLETIQEIPVELRGSIETCLATVIPPRNEDEARMLAVVGEEVLHRLPDSLSGLTAKQAGMTVRVAWLINGAGAIEKLAAYASDSRSKVQDQLIAGWLYFDTETYARDVLVKAPLNTRVFIDNHRLLPSLRHLNNLTYLSIYTDNEITDISFARNLSRLLWLDLNGLDTNNLDPVGQLRNLRRLWISMSTERHVSMATLENLGHLQDLWLWNVEQSDLTFLDRLPRLKGLGLELPREDHDLWYEPLSRQNELVRLSLGTSGQKINPLTFAQMRQLESLAFFGTCDTSGILNVLAEISAPLTYLSVSSPRLQDLQTLPRLPVADLQIDSCRTFEGLGDNPNLKSLKLANLLMSDLAPLAKLSNLESLVLNSARQVADLAPLAHCPNLKYLELRDVAVNVDLAPLAKTGLHITLGQTQSVRNAHLLDDTTKIGRERMDF
ncbi:NACHT domain-containing protein [Microtetraspora sp. NBRC 16547]|uniref:NACHT N-terminal Helical domain 1-containing protein n=1 Tax=Microtetraspora sp. NBRC 16547 TaxID=3030993 RepID=UPI00249FAC28|nr:NACHT domain-containing protein [Microtetraspora sp. NBRC 16547]GLW96396.1 ATP-binding protein [Microtetraspora sp. NBRC 16547]